METARARHHQRHQHILHRQQQLSHVRDCLRIPRDLRHRHVILQSLPLPMDGPLHQIRALYPRFGHAKATHLRDRRGPAVLRRQQRPNVRLEVDPGHAMGWDAGGWTANERVGGHPGELDPEHILAGDKQHWWYQPGQSVRRQLWLRFCGSIAADFAH